MPAVPNWLAGSMTAAILVGFGIFLYPWLLRRRYGVVAVAVISAALTLLYFSFDRGSGGAHVSFAFALLWAAAPVIAGVVVYRLQQR
jgi:hypothetical protein